MSTITTAVEQVKIDLNMFAKTETNPQMRVQRKNWAADMYMRQAAKQYGEAYTGKIVWEVDPATGLTGAQALDTYPDSLANIRVLGFYALADGTVCEPFDGEYSATQAMFTLTQSGASPGFLADNTQTMSVNDLVLLTGYHDTDVGVAGEISITPVQPAGVQPTKGKVELHYFVAGEPVIAS